jgi:parvulin-like peptidyl-prolyl isomerase
MGFTRRAAAAMALWTGACAAPAPKAPPPAARPASSTASAEVASVKEQLTRLLERSQASASGPSSRPASNPASSGPVVVKVAGAEYSFADAMDEFLFNYRGETHEILRKLAGDRIVEVYAAEYGITVETKDLDEGREAALQNLRTRVETEYGKDYTLAQFCENQLLTTLAEYEAQLTRSLRKTALAALVIRYDAVKSDRVSVRHIVVADKAAADAVLSKLRQGADFAATARQESLAPTKTEGGKIPPFDKGFDHPITAIAFSLPVGGLGGPVEDASGSKPIYHVVKVVEKVPASSASFAEVKDRLRQELRERPIERFEFEAFMRKAERQFPVEILGRRARTGETPRRAPSAPAGAGAAPGKSP